MTDTTEVEDAAVACFDKTKHFFEMAADLVMYYVVCPFMSAEPCRAYAERGMGSPLLFAGGFAVGTLAIATIVFIIRAYVDAIRVRRQPEEEEEEEEEIPQPQEKEILHPQEELTDEEEKEKDNAGPAQKIFKRTSFSSSRTMYIVRSDDVRVVDETPPVRQRRHRLVADVRRLGADPRSVVLRDRLRSSTIAIKQKMERTSSSPPADP